MLMNNTTLLGIVILLALSVALSATNPTTQDYAAYLEGILATELERLEKKGQAEKQTFAGELLKTQGTNLIEVIIRPNTSRDNYGLFSIFETRVLKVRIVVVGVGFQFIPIDDLDEILQKISSPLESK